MISSYHIKIIVTKNTGEAHALHTTPLTAPGRVIHYSVHSKERQKKLALFFIGSIHCKTTNVVYFYQYIEYTKKKNVCFLLLGLLFLNPQALVILLQHNPDACAVQKFARRTGRQLQQIIAGKNAYCIAIGSSISVMGLEFS